MTKKKVAQHLKIYATAKDKDKELVGHCQKSSNHFLKV